jgi:PAS domain S-box-containing protein
MDQPPRATIGPDLSPPAPAARARAFSIAIFSRRGMSTLFLIMGFLVIGAALVSGSLSAQKRRAASQDLYSHALEVMALGRETLSSLQDLEIGQRGYLLGRDPAFLEPYLRADRQIDGQLLELRELMSTTSERAAPLDQLASLVSGLRLNLAQGVQQAEAGNIDEAIEAYRSQSGKRIMDDIRSTMASIMTQEERALVERRIESRASGRTLAYYLLGLLAVGVGFVIFAISSAFSALTSGARADMESERAAAATRLAESERRFRTMTEAMPQIVWASTREGKFFFVNARWQDYTGSTGTQENWISHIHPDDREGVGIAWRHSIATGETYEREVRLRAADGVYRWYLCRAVPIRDEAGGIESWLGAGTDIHEAKLILEQRELLSQELSHRIKNIFSVVGSLVSLSARSDPSQVAFANTLRNRISALGRAHEFVRPHSPASAAIGGQRTFSAFVNELLGAYVDGEEPRVRFTGEDFTFGDKSATPLALVFHELGTNAAKYGALSTDRGHVEINAHIEGDTIIVAWLERGGPTVSGSPTREGFGTALARLSVEGQLDGSIDKQWAPEGLRVIVRIPSQVLAQT